EGYLFNKFYFHLKGLSISKKAFTFDLFVPPIGNISFDLVNRNSNNIFIKSIPNSTLKNIPTLFEINILETNSIIFDIKYFYLSKFLVLNSKIEINKSTFIFKSQSRLKIRSELLNILQNLYSTKLTLLNLKGFASIEILYAISLRQLNLQKLTISLI